MNSRRQALVACLPSWLQQHARTAASMPNTGWLCSTCWTLDASADVPAFGCGPLPKGHFECWRQRLTPKLCQLPAPMQSRPLNVHSSRSHPCAAKCRRAVARCGMQALGPHLDFVNSSSPVMVRSGVFSRSSSAVLGSMAAAAAKARAGSGVTSLGSGVGLRLRIWVRYLGERDRE